MKIWKRIGAMAMVTAFSALALTGCGAGGSSSGGGDSAGSDVSTPYRVHSSRSPSRKPGSGMQPVIFRVTGSMMTQAI